MPYNPGGCRELSRPHQAASVLASHVRVASQRGFEALHQQAAVGTKVYLRQTERLLGESSFWPHRICLHSPAERVGWILIWL